MKHHFLKSLLSVVLIFPVVLFGQEKKHMLLIYRGDSVRNRGTQTIISKKNIPQKDVSDLIRGLLKKPVSTAVDSITSKPAFSAVPAVGYTLASKLVATLSGNVAFHLRQAKISTITASAAYSQRKQFTMPVQSNIWTKGNNYNFIGDFRFYKYPQSTFGLGSNSLISNEDAMDYSYFRFYEVVLRKITGNLFAGLGYIMDYHWNISEKGLKSGLQSDYSKYGTAPHTVSSGITFNGLFDLRDNPINPSKGFYSAIQYRNSFKAFGSTTNWHSLIIDVRKYVQFPGSSENVLAFWTYNWLILQGTPPYLDLPSTSWDSYSSTGRGYIQGRFRGAQMVSGETEYRFRITRNGLFGGVLFANVESFSAAPGTRLQALQPGYGPGLRIKLNKVSKTNISIDYGFGNQGSKGLFINIGELF